MRLFNVLRLYPETGVGIVLMGNCTRYDHERIIQVILKGIHGPAGGELQMT
ncbi:MAG: hypothetical protein SYR96_17560 [Actinomycetota bacterium]|nr:hypothetical protein [Actinomycetota bacterium]